MQRFNNSREKPVEMSVKYRFKSSIEFSTVLFSGTYISVGDLRKEITKQKRLAPNADYELQIMNAETKHVYEFDPTLIPANTNLIVSRIPVVSKTSSSQRENELKKIGLPTSSPLPVPETNKFSNAIENTYYHQGSYENTNNDYDYSNYYGGEYGGNNGYDYGYYGEQPEGQNYYDYEYGYSANTDSNTAVEPNPNLQYVPMTTPIKSHRYVPYAYSRRTSKDNISVTPAGQNDEVSSPSEGQTTPSTSPTGISFGNGNPKYEKPPSAHYTCFKCNQPGHWIKHCPLFVMAQAQTVRKSTGIPRSQMVIVDDAVEGAYITPEGRYAVPVTHMEAKLAQRQ